MLRSQLDNEAFVTQQINDYQLFKTFKLPLFTIGLRAM